MERRGFFASCAAAFMSLWMPAPKMRSSLNIGPARGFKITRVQMFNDKLTVLPKGYAMTPNDDGIDPVEFDEDDVEGPL